MNSQILNYIGLGSVDIGYILIGMAVLIFIFCILMIIQMVKISKLKKKYSIFMQGKDAKSMEQDVIGLYEDNKFIKISMEKNKKDINELYKKIESSFQKMGNYSSSAKVWIRVRSCSTLELCWSMLTVVQCTPAWRRSFSRKGRSYSSGSQNFIRPVRTP